MWTRKNKNLPVSEFFTKIAYVQVINFITVKSFHAVSIYSVVIKFGTKFIIALCNVFKKIARTERVYFEKCHPVMRNLLSDVTDFCAMTSSPIFLNDNPLFLPTT
jgi:hypothetical protein